MPPLTVGLPNYGSYLGERPWRTLLDLAAAVEEAGLDGVSVVDHVVMGSRVEAYPYGRFPGGPHAPWLEPLTVLAAVGGVTERVELATAVLVSPLRPAALLAKTAATLDQLCGGRLVLGIGTGWQEEEYRALGADWDRRHRVLDDQLAACRELWTGGPVTLDAETVTLEGIHCHPRPVRPGGVPFWIGGRLTERNLTRIVRWGSGWIPAPVDRPDDVAAGVRRLRAALVAAGRDPASVRVRVTPEAVRDGAGRVDLAASLAGAAGLLAAGGTDLFVSLMGWCPDPAGAPGFLRDLAAAHRAAG
ncbi:TIGR03619 family F420-dependent LLM class oxidoreductase [Trujillonella humicola]|uniref:TIGR03619 family F420-dependent LLM class oxidoreductase n=1 Tax=Trujillonella humicola TaxID=3383699 RepID=UPI003906AB6B